MRQSDWKEARCVSAAVVVAIVVAMAASIIVIWSWLVRWDGLRTITAASHGLLHPTLLASLVSAAFVGAIAAAARLSVGDFGIFRRDLREGVTVWVGAFCGVQLMLAIVSLLSGQGIHEGRWFSQPTGLAVGSLIAQLFGTGLVEEATYRGFLFRQCLARTRVPRSRASYAVAAMVAAIPFSLSHIPQRVVSGLHGSNLALELLGLWMVGLLATYLYVRSRNLMLVIALHAVFNDPAPLVASPLPVRWAAGCVVLVVIVVIEVRARRPPV